MQAFYTQIIGDHPLRALFGAPKSIQYKKNDVSGLKEGDFRTATGQWIQSKRNNSRVVSFNNVYNTLNRIIGLLDTLTKPLSYNKYNNNLKHNIAEQFSHAYSSEKINKKLIDQISRELNLFGQPLL